jgi:hypothetical protein
MDAPVGAPPPFFCSGGKGFRAVVCKTRTQTASRERFLTSSLPGLTRQSMQHNRSLSRTRHVSMDHRVKPAVTKCGGEPRERDSIFAAPAAPESAAIVLDIRGPCR